MSETRTYKKRDGVDNDHGIKFVWHTTSLAYLRCAYLHRNKIKETNSFIIANNVDYVGAFDDVVVKVEYMHNGEEKMKVIFVQCKHVDDIENQKKRVDKLLENDIQKYFNSFVTILRIVKDSNDHGVRPETFEIIERSLLSKELNRHNISSEVTNRMEQNVKERIRLEELLNCNLSDCEFLIYTNAKCTEFVPEAMLHATIENPVGDDDITDKIFDTVNARNSRFKHSESLNLDGMINNEFKIEGTVFQQLKTEFINKLKIYCNQAENIEKEVGKLIEKNYLLENVSEKLITEIQHNFSGKQCTVLSEKSNLLHLIESYSQLRANSMRIQEASHSSFSSKSIFYDKAIRALKIPQRIESFRKSFQNCKELEKYEIMKLSYHLNTTQKEKNFLVFIDDDSDMETWIKARETKIYKKFIYVFIVCSLKLDELIRPEENEFVITNLRHHDAYHQEQNSVKKRDPVHDDIGKSYKKMKTNPLLA